jgi:hypothetical protein
MLGTKPDEPNARAPKAPDPIVGNDLTAGVNLLARSRQRETQRDLGARLMRQAAGMLDRDAAGGDVLRLAEMQVRAVRLRDREGGRHPAGTAPIFAYAAAIARCPRRPRESARMSTTGSARTTGETRSITSGTHPLILGWPRQAARNCIAAGARPVDG